MYSDYQCTKCNTIRLIRKTTPIGHGFETNVNEECETCNSYTIHKRLYSKPYLPESGGWDDITEIYKPSPLTPMNKIEHFNKGLGRTSGVEEGYTL